jgi:hypothetical protein
MTQEERNEMIAQRDKELLEQHELYKSLMPKVVCKQWGLTYSGYQQVIYRHRKIRDSR